MPRLKLNICNRGVFAVILKLILPKIFQKEIFIALIQDILINYLR